jgi:hypothetical protein
LSFLNRSYNQATIELHRKNRLGTFIPESVKKKMSDSHLRIKNKKQIILIDVNTGNKVFFDTIAALRRELLISDRTIRIWALDGKTHKTKSLKYPLIKIKI